MRRETYSGIGHVAAECRNCDWSSTARNAIGNAARHHDATGHTVVAEQLLSISYGPPESDDGSPPRNSPASC